MYTKTRSSIAALFWIFNALTVTNSFAPPQPAQTMLNEAQKQEMLDTAGNNTVLIKEANALMNLSIEEIAIETTTSAYRANRILNLLPKSAIGPVKASLDKIIQNNPKNYLATKARAIAHGKEIMQVPLHGHPYISSEDSNNNTLDITSLDETASTSEDKSRTDDFGESLNSNDISREASFSSDNSYLNPARISTIPTDLEISMNSTDSPTQDTKPIELNDIILDTNTETRLKPVRTINDLEALPIDATPINNLPELPVDAAPIRDLERLRNGESLDTPTTLANLRPTPEATPSADNPKIPRQPTESQQTTNPRMFIKEENFENYLDNISDIKHYIL